MSRSYRIWPVLAFFLVAMSLEVAPMPEAVAPWRPPWVALSIIYWSMHRPGRYGVGVAWLIGLLLDVLKGAVLGQNALTLALAAYVTIKLCQRLRVFPIWQQALSVSLIIAVLGFVDFWIDGMTGQLHGGSLRLAPIVSAMVVWPPLTWFTDRFVASRVRS